MKINRDNYEEFFILYMDNELNEADRRMVESFISNHPDLKEELDILLQYKLIPDTDIVFEGKEELMMMEAAGKAGLEESLLFYIDDELQGEQKKNFEKLLANDQSLQNELALLQKTKLQPETILYPGKAALYKTEKTYRIGIRWWRIAAAAVLLIGIGFATFKLVSNNNHPAIEIVKNEPVQKPTVPVKEAPAPGNNSTATEQQDQEDRQSPSNRGIAIHPDQSKNNQLNIQGDKNFINPAKQDQPEELTIAANNNKTNNLPDANENPYVNNINKADAVQGNNVASIDNEPLTKPAVTTERPQPYIVQASYTENDVMEPESKKNKLRGLFRKVTRTFEKRTNIEATDNDNKLLVAGLSINLK
jgi:hypothetical protein